MGWKLFYLGLQYKNLEQFVWLDLLGFLTGISKVNSFL